VGTRELRDTPFLLRLWQVNNGDQPVWRLSLEQADGQARLVFANLDGLTDFLTSQMAVFPDSGPASKQGAE
jgi:hypothetical protein